MSCGATRRCFPRDDEVEAQWRICDPIIDMWEASRARPAIYPAGSQGPQEATSVLWSGDAWRDI